MQGETKLRCVVADDHEALRLGLVRGLEASGTIEVVGEAEDGATALSLIERRAPAVAVLDHHMPGLDGIAVAQALTTAGLSLRVVLYTGESAAETVDRALEAGIAGFVLKTSPLSEVARAVELVARGETYVDPVVVGELLARRSQSEKSLLSQREVEVLQLLADGHTTAAVAEELFLSPATVRSYLEGAMSKLGSRSRTHAVAAALRDDLIR